MKIEIYINGRPVEEYPEDEMNAIKQKLTETAMSAAGYIKKSAAEKRAGE